MMPSLIALDRVSLGMAMLKIGFCSLEDVPDHRVARLVVKAFVSSLVCPGDCIDHAPEC